MNQSLFQTEKEKKNSEVDDKPVTKRQKTTLSTRQKTTFTSTNRNFIRNLFLIDGQTPETLSGNRINEMREENEDFDRIVKDLETKKSKEKSTAPLNDRVNQAIRKCATVKLKVKAKIP